jgi:hypothetical protein
MKRQQIGENCIIEELHNLYSSPSIIRMIKSRRTRLEVQVARIVPKRVSWESQKERDHWEDQDVCG